MSIKLSLEPSLLSSGISQILIDYISNFQKNNNVQIPLLLGHTGVGKSSIVKSVIKYLNDYDISNGGYGYKLIDIRAGFLDKADLMGFCEPSQLIIDDVTYEAYKSSPLYELIITSDTVHDYARDALKHKKGLAKSTIEKLEYLAKQSVLFFDEINRCLSNSVRSQLMVLINQGRLNNIYFTHTPRIAAANWPTLEVEEELAELYTIETDRDEARKSRMRIYGVNYTDTSLQNSIHYYFLKKFPKLETLINKVFSPASKINKYLYNPIIHDSNKNFPNYRSWEYLLQYIQWILDNKKSSISNYVMSGLLGQTAFNAISIQLLSLINKIGNTNIEYSSSFDPISELIQMSIDTHIPSLLLGRMGIAKTAKVEQLAKANNCYIFHIDLSSIDKTMIHGMVYPTEFNNVIFNDDEFKKIKSEYKLDFLMTTNYVPDAGLIQTVHSCIKDNKQLIIFIDEFNRASSSTLQSAILELISDKKIFGVDFTKYTYENGESFDPIIIAAGNISDPDDLNDCVYDVLDNDAAIINRFCLYSQSIITENDLQSFILWAKNSPSFNKTLFNEISKLISNDEHKAKLLNLLNTRGLKPGTYSDGYNQILITLRSFESLSDILNNISDKFILSLMTNQTMWKSMKPREQLNYLISKSNWIVYDLIDRKIINLSLNNSAINSSDELIKVIKGTMSKSENDELTEILDELLLIDNQILNSRVLPDIISIAGTTYLFTIAYNVLEFLSINDSVSGTNIDLITTPEKWLDHYFSDIKTNKINIFSYANNSINVSSDVIFENILSELNTPKFNKLDDISKMNIIDAIVSYITNDLNSNQSTLKYLLADIL